MSGTRCSISVFCLASLVFSGYAVAQEDVSDKLQSGEAGYTVGCSLAASAGVPACAELPSGKKTQQDQDAADTSAAMAAIQQKRADAAAVSASTAQAIQNLQRSDSQDSADTSAATALLLQLHQAADELEAKTPPPQAVEDAATSSNSTDPPQEKVPAYTFTQRAMAWGVAGMSAQDTQNDPPSATTQEPSPNEAAPEDSDDDTQANDQNGMSQYSTAMQVYQQAMRALNSYAAARRNMPSPAQINAAQGSQIQNGSSGISVQFTPQGQSQPVPQACDPGRICNKNTPAPH